MNDVATMPVNDICCQKMLLLGTGFCLSGMSLWFKLIWIKGRCPNWVRYNNCPIMWAVYPTCSCGNKKINLFPFKKNPDISLPCRLSKQGTFYQGLRTGWCRVGPPACQCWHLIVWCKALLWLVWGPDLEWSRRGWRPRCYIGFRRVEPRALRVYP